MGMTGLDTEGHPFMCSREMTILLKHVTNLCAESKAVASPFKVGDLALALA